MKIVALSDTHMAHRKIKIPDADLLLHAGDFTYQGDEEEIKDFADWLSSIKNVTYKVVIAGNHELGLERHPKLYEPLLSRACYYLNDNIIELCGLKIFGSPVTPEFGQWAFTYPRGPEMFEHWKVIPNNIDILLTHGPAYGLNDSTFRGGKVGCTDLLYHLGRVKPKMHVYGHIHSDPGESELEHSDGSVTKCYNVAMLNDMYDLARQPTIIEI